MILRLKNLIWNLRILEVLQVEFIGFSGLGLSGQPLLSFPSMAYLSAMFCHLLSAFTLNDFQDWDWDRTNERKPKAPLSKKQLIVITVFFMVLSLGLAVFVSLQQFGFFIFFNICSILYSLPPVRLKTRLLMPLLIHLILGCGYFLSGIQLGTSIATGTLLAGAFFWGLVLGSGSLANEIVDRDADQKIGIRTLGNVLTLAKSIQLLTILQVSSLIVLAQVFWFRQLPQLSGVVIVALAFYFFALYRYFRESDFPKFRNRYRLIFVLAILMFSTVAVCT